MKISISKASEADIPGIAQVAGASFPDPWSEEGFRAELCREAAVFLAARDEDGRVIGFITGDVEDISAGYIADIAVAPEARRQGTAAALLREFQKSLPVHTESITLEVRAGNSSAISLYTREGFRSIGVRKGFYGAVPGVCGAEDAIVMEKTINNQYLIVKSDTNYGQSPDNY